MKLSRRFISIAGFATLVWANAAYGQMCISNEIIIRFKDTAQESATNKIFADLKAQEIRYAYKKAFVTVKMPPGTSAGDYIASIRANPSVAHVQPNYIYSAQSLFDDTATSPNDALYESQWNFEMINVAEAWQFSTGKGVVVAVLDSGVHRNGRDGFGGRLLNGYNAFLNIEALWEDTNSHGTHVAGTIAQETNNSLGVAGIAFNAKILPVKVLNRNLNGTTETVVAGIRWAADHDADIISMSLGADNVSTETDLLVREAVDYAYKRGILLIAASGNSNTFHFLSPSVSCPACYENVIAVGSVDFRKDHVETSNGGPDLDIAAPGGDRNTSGHGILQETFRTSGGFAGFAFGWGYYYKHGTSMATPHVSGVAALIKSIHPDWGPEEIREALVKTAVDLGDPGHDDYYGYGLLDAAAAVHYKN